MRNQHQIIHNNIINRSLNLNIAIFCNDIGLSWNDWKTATSNTAIVLNNLNKGIKFYPEGLDTFPGVPVVY
jgi:hypothetical protein